MKILADEGIVYVAMGTQFINEANLSAATVKKFHPQIPIAIFCDLPDKVDRKLIRHVIQIKSPQGKLQVKKSSIRQLVSTPFETTLFLDTDTLALAPFAEVFDLAGKFDLAAAHAPWRMMTPSDDCPDCFPELNTGVILYNRTDAVIDLLENWERIYLETSERKGKAQQDQPSFREAVWSSNVRFFVLPPEYNLRAPFASFAGGNAKVKILHGRNFDVPEVSELLNRQKAPRAFPPVKKLVQQNRRKKAARRTTEKSAVSKRKSAGNGSPRSSADVQ